MKNASINDFANLSGVGEVGRTSGTSKTDSTAAHNSGSAFLLDLKQHPLSAVFPPMADADFQALKDSIENIGIQNPIVLFEGMVIDGWHRYLAAKETRSACPTVELGDVDPKDFVLAQNERRRHLSASQIADAVVRVSNWQPTGRPKVLPGSTLSKTNAELATLAGVSTATIRQAKFVQTHAKPEIQAGVKSGEISLKGAAVLCRRTKPKPAKVATAKPTVIDSECQRVSEQPELEELRDRYDEMASSFRETLTENESMGRVFDSDDKVLAALAEAKRFREMNSTLNARVTGLMNELSECKRLLKGAQRRADKAESALKGASHAS